MGKNMQAEAVFQEQFPPLKLSINVPATIEDSGGQAVAYYLPDVLNASRQVSHLNSSMSLMHGLRLSTGPHRRKHEDLGSDAPRELAPRGHGG